MTTPNAGPVNAISTGSIPRRRGGPQGRTHDLFKRLLAAGGSCAREYESDEGIEGHVPVVAHEVFLLAPGETVGRESIQADLDHTTEMTHHHEGVIRLLYLDIIVDRAYEIGFLLRIVDRFPGDPDAVAIDESIPGTDLPLDLGGSTGGMDHGGHH